MNDAWTLQVYRTQTGQGGDSVLKCKNALLVVIGMLEVRKDHPGAVFGIHHNSSISDEEHAQLLLLCSLVGLNLAPMFGPGTGA